MTGKAVAFERAAAVRAGLVASASLRDGPRVFGRLARPRRPTMPRRIAPDFLR